MTQIKLSILIPLYNYNEGFAKIINCIENISDNLFNNYEIIISDDSELPIINNAEIKNLKNKLNHFRYIHNKERLGAVKNWNKLIKLSKGDYIWLLHQDEYWNKDEIITFHSICKQCITSFGGKIIVNFKDNTYFWIKDYDTDKEYLMHTKNIT